MKRQPGIPVQVRQLVQAIQDHIRNNGTAPTDRELAAELGYSTHGSVTRWVSAARKLGLIEHRPGSYRGNVPVAEPGTCRACGHQLETG